MTHWYAKSIIKKADDSEQAPSEVRGRQEAVDKLRADAPEVFSPWKLSKWSPGEWGWAGAGALAGGAGAWLLSKLFRPKAKSWERLLYILAGASGGLVLPEVLLANTKSGLKGFKDANGIEALRVLNAERAVKAGRSKGNKLVGHIQDYISKDRPSWYLKLGLRGGAAGLAHGAAAPQNSLAVSLLRKLHLKGTADWLENKIGYKTPFTYSDVASAIAKDNSAAAQSTIDVNGNQALISRPSNVPSTPFVVTQDGKSYIANPEKATIKPEGAGFGGRVVAAGADAIGGSLIGLGIGAVVDAVTAAVDRAVNGDRRWGIALANALTKADQAAKK